MRVNLCRLLMASYFTPSRSVGVGVTDVDKDVWLKLKSVRNDGASSSLLQRAESLPVYFIPDKARSGESCRWALSGFTVSLWDETKVKWSETFQLFSECVGCSSDAVMLSDAMRLMRIVRLRNCFLPSGNVADCTCSEQQKQPRWIRVNAVSGEARGASCALLKVPLFAYRPLKFVFFILAERNTNIP